MPKTAIVVRDSILFITLLLMINHALTQSKLGKIPTKQAASLHVLDQHDKRVLRHIAQLQREIDAQLHSVSSEQQITQLKDLQQELVSIAQDYTHLSPGTAPLGPISSIFLVFKQRTLQKRISEIEKLIYEVAYS